MTEFQPPLVDDSVEYECKDGSVYLKGKGYVDARVCTDHSCKVEAGKPHKKRCRKYQEAWMEHIIPHTDLRSVTRGADTSRTTIEIVDRYDMGLRHKWITCGWVNIRTDDRRPGDVELICYLTAGVTDFEHSSAYAFQLPLIGWTFHDIDYNAVSFYAWVSPAMDPMRGFRVPGPGYNPMEREDACLCEEGECAKEPHIVVEEGFFIAPDNPELYKLVKGQRVRVTIRPVYEHEKEE
jgi:hypothetical protein